MTQKPNLVLVGFMGTGKSTLGALLARKLGMEFLDTDHLIEREAGMSVSEIFATSGEAVFRRIESEVCREVAARSGQVIAAGGGALLNRDNRSALEATGVLVLLTCSVEVLVHRLEESARRGERPLLRGDVNERVLRLLGEREEVYSSVRLQVDSGISGPEQTAEEIAALYKAELAKRLEAGVA